MNCPQCGSDQTKVLESRVARENAAIRRRRECLGCTHRFTTFEMVEKPRLLVVKRDGTREEFDREKILTGMITATGKRPVTLTQLREAVDNIERAAQRLGLEEISSQEIAERVMGELWRVDTVAFVRFASVYGRFENPSQFVQLVEDVDQLQTLTDGPPEHIVSQLHGNPSDQQPSLPLE